MREQSVRAIEFIITQKDERFRLKQEKVFTPFSVKQPQKCDS